MRFPDLIILDASVLINYIHVQRLDLLAECWAEVRVIEQVRAELAYEDQKSRFEDALKSGQLHECAIDDPALISEALRLVQIDRHGSGESYSFVFAKANQVVLGIDDKAARHDFARREPSLIMVTSKDLMVRALRTQLISVAEADAIKETWARDCRYRLKLKSFGELSE